MKNKKFIVYEHISPSNKVYIGITSKTLKLRCGKNGYCYKDSKKFYNAIKKYGWDNFKHNILLENQPESAAKYAEKYLIRWYKMHKMSYNITDGGEGTLGLSHSMSQELREKLSKINKGRKLSQETKEKLRKCNLGKKASKETREKLRISHLGHKDSDITKKRKSLAGKGRIHSKESIEKMKKNRAWYKHSQETKEKIRKTLQDTSNRNITILQYDLNNNFIAEYKSAAEAGRILKIDPSNILKVANGKFKKYKNYIWKKKI